MVDDWIVCLLLGLAMTCSFKRILALLRPTTDVMLLQAPSTTLATTAFLCSASFSLQHVGAGRGLTLTAFAIALSLAIDRSLTGSKAGILLAVSSLTIFLALSHVPFAQP